MSLSPHQTGRGFGTIRILCMGTPPCIADSRHNRAGWHDALRVNERSVMRFRAERASPHGACDGPSVAATASLDPNRVGFVI
ncbi:MAG: hypothetical protein VB858_08275 [Planctomycetaceae bacterium]